MKRHFHSHFTDHLFKHTPDTVHQYWKNLFVSKKCRNMSCGSAEILRLITWAHGDNWRRMHPKSERKHHKRHH